MRVNRNLLALAAAVVCCTIVVWFSTSIQGVPKTYEVRPQVSIPEYRTDAARAIDAYERLMERYMDLTERSLLSVAGDVRDVMKKLDSIDHKLTALGSRTARIEEALGIEHPKPPIKEKHPPKALNKKATSSTE
ncbi:MAG: hypothetical protein ACYSW7_11760 [Planctomycetota bacterium]|jgi:hypothetical protein